ncbi:MAG: endonuclease domain-containing protein [Armatimonas sp.]
MIQQWAQENRRNATEAEALLWAALRSRQVAGMKFRRQHPTGRFVFDFWCPEQRLAIELDGGYHEESEQAAKDTDCDQEIRKFGVQLLRFTNEEVLTNLNAVLDKISESAPPLPERPEV